MKPHRHTLRLIAGEQSDNPGPGQLRVADVAEVRRDR